MKSTSSQIVSLLANNQRVCICAKKIQIYFQSIVDRQQNVYKQDKAATAFLLQKATAQFPR
jgi:hypothetical protein